MQQPNSSCIGRKHSCSCRQCIFRHDVQPFGIRNPDTFCNNDLPLLHLLVHNLEWAESTREKLQTIRSWTSDHCMWRTKHWIRRTIESFLLDAKNRSSLRTWSVSLISIARASMSWRRRSSRTTNTVDSMAAKMIVKTPSYSIAKQGRLESKKSIGSLIGLESRAICDAKAGSIIGLPLDLLVQEQEELVDFDEGNHQSDTCWFRRRELWSIQD